MQVSYDPLDYADKHGVTVAEGAVMAKRDRDADLRARRKRGENVQGWRLTGQLRKWAGLGVPDGRVRTVYYINVY